MEGDLPMAKPSKLAHVVYMTRRYEEMLSWYKTVFEARVQYENPAFAFLTYDDEHHRFAFANMDVLSPNGEVKDMPARYRRQSRRLYFPERR